MLDISSTGWEHYNPVKVIGGAGAIARLNQLVHAGARLLLVTTPGFTRRGVTARLVRSLSPRPVVVYDAVTPNPELEDIDQATARLQPNGVTAIVALGGGSVIDTAKLLGVTMPSQVQLNLARTLRPGLAHRFTQRLPVIAIPTTSGTGAEVTPFATVWDKSAHKKYSVAAPEIFPSYAVLDPDLTLALPPDQTLYSALDAISHSLESLWNINRTFLTARLSLQALELANRALPAILHTPHDPESRAAMQHASLLAGLAISQTRTAIAHSISYPLTTHFGVPHGLACSFTLQELLMANRDMWAGDAIYAPLLTSITAMLRRLPIAKRMLSYATLPEILSLGDAMLGDSRAGNYNGSLGQGLARLLTDSLNTEPLA